MRFKAHWARIVIASIALAFGFSDAAIARPVTFAWDASPDWTVGTTVELEANGVSANGITASQHILDVPVQPGEVVNARARAIPPSGYECCLGDIISGGGNPPVYSCSIPLELCPPSPWSESLVQTIPQNPSGVWAIKELVGGGGIMAAPTFIAQYATAFNSDGSSKTAMSAVSINSDDVIVLVSASENYLGLTSETENGAGSFTNQEVFNTSNYCYTRASTYIAPANETITINVTKTGAIAYFGGNAVRFSGSSGIGATEINNGASGTPSVSITTTQANSAIVVIASDWNASTGSQTFTSSGGAGSPSDLTGFPGDNSHYGVAVAYYADAGSAGSKTVGMSAPTNQKWAIIAIEVKGSAGASTQEAGLTLPVSPSISQTKTADFLAGMTLAAAAGTISGKSADIPVSVSLPASIGAVLGRALSTLAALQFGTSAAQTASAMNAAESNISLPVTHGMTESVLSDLLTTTTLASQLALSNAPVSDLLSAVSLAISNAITSTTANNFSSAITMALQASAGAVGQADAQAGLSFPALPAVAPVGQSDRVSGLTLSATPGLSLAGDLDTLSSLTLPASVSLTWAGESLGQGEGEMTLGFTASSTSSATAVLGAGLTLAAQALFSPSGANILQSALALGQSLAVAFDYDTAKEGGLTLGASLALADAAVSTLTGIIPLGAVVGNIHGALIDAVASLIIPLTPGATLSGGLDLDSGVSLSWTLGFNGDALQYTAETVFPGNRRIILIRASDRVISIDASDRIIVAGPIDRLLN